jgi:hypothetical protein
LYIAGEQIWMDKSEVMSSCKFRAICKESFRPGLSQPGLKLEKGLKSYVYL